MTQASFPGFSKMRLLSNLAASLCESQGAFVHLNINRGIPPETRETISIEGAKKDPQGSAAMLSHNGFDELLDLTRKHMHALCSWSFKLTDPTLYSSSVLYFLQLEVTQHLHAARPRRRRASRSVCQPGLNTPQIPISRFVSPSTLWISMQEVRVIVRE
jgi:hypothetical protein